VREIGTYRAGVAVSGDNVALVVGRAEDFVEEPVVE
jgi:hypothetical protein